MSISFSFPQFSAREYDPEKQRALIDELTRAFTQVQGKLDDLDIEFPEPDFSGLASADAPFLVHESDALLPGSRRLEAGANVSLDYSDTSRVVISAAGGGTPDPLELESVVWRGYVSANASSATLPDGWSASAVATGVKRVTHDLGVSPIEMGIVVTPQEHATFHVVPATDHFDVHTFRAAALYKGQATASGVGSGLADGFSIVRVSIGNYDLIHNLNLPFSQLALDVQVVDGTGPGTGSRISSTVPVDNNRIRIRINQALGSGPATDNAFSFILAVRSAEPIDVPFSFTAIKQTVGIPPDPELDALLWWNDAAKEAAWLAFPLNVGRGGTGRSSLTNTALLIGAGTDEVNFLSPGAAAQVVRSDGTAWVSAQLAFADLDGQIGNGQVPDSAVSQHQGALSIDWSQLASVPAEFPPEAHVHAAGEVTSGTFHDDRIAESNVTQYQGALSIDWSQLASVPSTFPPEAHGHTIMDVTGLASVLNDIADATYVTVADETGLYANSRRIVAGSNITVDTTTSGEIEISASGGGSGTVTSVDMSVPTGFTIGGNPITGAGTLALAYDTGYLGYTTAEATKLSGIATGATVGATWGSNITSQPAVVGQAEAEAGTATTERMWTAQRVAQAIAALESGGGGGASDFTDLGDTPGSITANGFVRGNAGGTALEFVTEIPDGALSDNVALKNAVNVLTFAAGSGDYPTKVATAAPFSAWEATGQSANNKLWDAGVVDTQFRLRVLGDGGSSASTWLSATRSGVTVTGITLAAPTRIERTINAGFLSLAPTNGTANSRRWRFGVNASGSLTIQTSNDAESAVANAVEIARSGTTVTGIALNANTALNGTLDLSSHFLMSTEGTSQWMDLANGVRIRGRDTSGNLRTLVTLYTDDLEYFGSGLNRTLLRGTSINIEGPVEQLIVDGSGGISDIEIRTPAVAYASTASDFNFRIGNISTVTGRSLYQTNSVNRRRVMSFENVRSGTSELAGWIGTRQTHLQVGGMEGVELEHGGDTIIARTLSNGFQVEGRLNVDDLFSASTETALNSSFITQLSRQSSNWITWYYDRDAAPSGWNWRSHASGSSYRNELTLDNNGNLVARGNVTAASDARLKTNLEIIPDALRKVSRLVGYTFTRTDQDDKAKRYAGLIAQDVQKVLPEVVSSDEDGTLSVAYGNIVGLLVEAIKALNDDLQELRHDLAS